MFLPPSPARSLRLAAGTKKGGQQETLFLETGIIACDVWARHTHPPHPQREPCHPPLFRGFASGNWETAQQPDKVFPCSIRRTLLPLRPPERSVCPRQTHACGHDPRPCTCVQGTKKTPQLITATMSFPAVDERQLRSLRSVHRRQHEFSTSCNCGITTVNHTPAPVELARPAQQGH